MKIVTVLGARPQFIKAAAVSRVIGLNSEISEIIVHTGQHYDADMSQVFFEQLDIPRPSYELSISGLSHGAMTGRMMEQIEAILLREAPSWVLVYGDTNSTLAGALSANKLGIPVAHVEAGLRSHNPAMPEEINRVLTDRFSSLLLCPTAGAVENLMKEKYPFSAIGAGRIKSTQRIVNVGDVMFDALVHYQTAAKTALDLRSMNLEPRSYVLCTLHRQENTDDPDRLSRALTALLQIAEYVEIVWPLHPRTRAKLEQFGLSGKLSHFKVIPPLPYLELQRLLMSAKVLVTDSGGMQKEAYFHQIPCVTLRKETEWNETVAAGWNTLVPLEPHGDVVSAVLHAGEPTDQSVMYYGNGHAAEKIVESICAG